MFESYPSHPLTGNDLIGLRDLNAFFAYSNVEKLADLNIINTILNLIAGEPLKLAEIIKIMTELYGSAEAKVLGQILLMLKYGVFYITP